MHFSTGHALLMGVGTYVHTPQLNVPITAADAQAVAAVLRDPRFCGYPPEQVTLLADADASRAGVLAALDTLAARVGTDDTVVLFYAGHGAYSDDGYALTTFDTRIANHKIVSGSGVRADEVIEKVRAIKAARVLLIINACHAGECSPVLAAGAEPLTVAPLPPQVSAALLGTGTGRVIISACREQQYAFIGPGPLTLFTQALVDGLQGTGVNSNHGYISIFDLYTYLYFRLDELVPRLITAAVRQRYGEKQEPELTILKGVGPFAVALFRGATPLGSFDDSGVPPESTAVREVNPAYSQQMMRQHQQHIGGHARVGTAIAGDVRGNLNVTQQGDTINTGGGNVIRVGNITDSSGVAIGHGAHSSVRHVSTGGGDYAEGAIDKRQGTFVSGDQLNMSGNFSGAMLTIKSTLAGVSQHIAATKHSDAPTKAQAQALLDQFSNELQHVPPAMSVEAEQVAKRIADALTEATKPQPDRDDVAYNLSRFQQAVERIGNVLPSIITIATQLVAVVRSLMGT